MGKRGKGAQTCCGEQNKKRGEAIVHATSEIGKYVNWHLCSLVPVRGREKGRVRLLITVTQKEEKSSNRGGQSRRKG